MVFSSLAFLFFFLPTTLAAYFIWRSRVWRNLVLLGTSLFFYAWGEPRYVVLMIISILVNWALALAIHHQHARSRMVLAGGVMLNLIGIGVFKYAAFLMEGLNAAAGTHFPAPQVALPIGISFYTFQAISYLVDVQRGLVRPQRNPLYFGTYLGMFPQLIAGPIVRYESVERELMQRMEGLGDFAVGLRRFAIGLGKKVLIANTMGSVADTVIAAGPSVGLIPAWFAFVAYSFQIYFDFSGYSDMAIGLGRMFGFHFLENFNYPYVARSVTEFWRRWHISLSTFFRDYVYIPLGGNRVTRGRWVFNLLFVWALTGLWHGASWNFVTWGLYYGLLLLGERLLWGQWLGRMPIPAQHVYSIVSFIFGWVIFRIEDFREMGQWLAALLGGYGSGSAATLNALNVLHYYPWCLVAAVGSTPFAARWLRRLDAGPALGWVHDGYVFAIFSWAVLALVLGGFNPFIYFRF